MWWLRQGARKLWQAFFSQMTPAIYLKVASSLFLIHKSAHGKFGTPGTCHVKASYRQTKKQTYIQTRYYYYYYRALLIAKTNGTFITLLLSKELIKQFVQLPRRSSWCWQTVNVDTRSLSRDCVGHTQTHCLCIDIIDLTSQGSLGSPAELMDNNLKKFVDVIQYVILHVHVQLYVLSLFTVYLELWGGKILSRGESTPSPP